MLRNENFIKTSKQTNDRKRKSDLVKRKPTSEFLRILTVTFPPSEDSISACKKPSFGSGIQQAFLPSKIWVCSFINFFLSTTRYWKSGSSRGNPVIDMVAVCWGPYASSKQTKETATAVGKESVKTKTYFQNSLWNEEQNHYLI